MTERWRQPAEELVNRRFELRGITPVWNVRLVEDIIRLCESVEAQTREEMRQEMLQEMLQVFDRWRQSMVFGHLPHTEGVRFLLMLSEAQAPDIPAAPLQRVWHHGWPEAVSDGLTLPCADCGQIPRFDYQVADEFWRQHVPTKPARIGVVCLPCLDRRCGGVGLAEAVMEIQWTGTGHTVVCQPTFRHTYEPSGPRSDIPAAPPAHHERHVVDALLSALEPFASIGAWLFARPEVPNEEVMVTIEGINGLRGAFTRGQFKSAYRAYAEAVAPPATSDPDDEDDWTPEQVAELRQEFSAWLAKRDVPPDVRRMLTPWLTAAPPTTDGGR